MGMSFSENYQNFKIFFTFLLFWFSIQFGEFVEDIVAYFLVITLGILHGANDLLIIDRVKRNKNEFLKNLIIYLIIILSCVLLFFITPKIAILCFIVISAYHFGEEHFGEALDVGEILNSLYFFFYGLLIFAMIFFNSLTDVNEIMNQLVGSVFSVIQIDYLLFSSILIYAFLSAYYVFNKRLKIEFIVKEIFYLLLLFLVFKTTSLILGFAIYFIFWHSIPSILHQVIFLSGDLKKDSLIIYIRKAGIFWLISVFGMLLLYFFIPQLDLFATVVFIILFAVTAPHMWVMFQMKK